MGGQSISRVGRGGAVVAVALEPDADGCFAGRVGQAAAGLGLAGDRDLDGAEEAGPGLAWHDLESEDAVGGAGSRAAELAGDTLHHAGVGPGGAVPGVPGSPPPGETGGA